MGAPSSSDELGAGIADVGDINGDGQPDFAVASVPALGTGELTDHVYVVFDAKTLLTDGILDFTKINGSNGFRLDAPTLDFLGVAITHCDFDGDGIDDLIIGAPGTPVSNQEIGAVFVIYGSKKGFPATIDVSTLDPKVGFRIDADTNLPGNQAVGASLACRQNPSGSGPQDILIGAPATLTFPNGSGSVYVVYGQTQRPQSPLSLSALATKRVVRLDGVNGGNTIAGTGTSLAGVGDVNGDGKADFVFNCDPNSDAIACIVFGGAPLPETMKVSDLAPPIGTFIGSGTTGISGVIALGASRGIANKAVGDILLGTYSSSSTIAYVVFGRASGISTPIELSDLDATTGWQILDSIGGPSTFVTSIGATRDLDGDGVPDLLIGTDNGSTQLFGRWSYLLSSRVRHVFSTDIGNLSSITGMPLCEESISGGPMQAIEVGDVLGTGIPAMLLSIGYEAPTAGGIYIVNGSDRIFGTGFDSAPQSLQQICQFN